MPTVCIDASAIIAVEFNEDGRPQVLQRLTQFDQVVSSVLLEAEVRAKFARERVDFRSESLARIEWIHPVQRLDYEMEAVLNVGYLRGGDLLHVATAFHFFHSQPRLLTFLTLDTRQRAVAAALGFQT